MMADEIETVLSAKVSDAIGVQDEYRKWKLQFLEFSRMLSIEKLTFNF